MISNKLKNTEYTYTSISETVTKALTDAILKGQLKPGDQLVEMELQKYFKISRSPLREAYRELEKRGLLEIIPRKGTFVKKITKVDILENFPVRAVLEGLAAKISYNRMSEKQIQNLEQIYLKMKKAIEHDKLDIYWKQHRYFHYLFIDACGNQLLIKQLETLRTHMMLYSISYNYFSEDFNKTLNEHKRLLEMFKSSRTDVNRLESYVRSHIEKALPFFIKYIESVNMEERA